jgi:hypothetical protein
LSSRLRSLVLHVSAESAYRLYVNGTLVGRGPVRGTRSVGFFDSYEVAPLVRVGVNWIAADVHCHNRPTFRANPVEPALLVQSDDGTVATDASWQVQPADEWRSDAPLFTFQIGHMEWQDLRGEPLGWQTGEDRSEWQSPVVVSSDETIGGKKLLPRDIPALTEEIVLPADVRAIAATSPLESVDDREVAVRMTREAHQPLAQPIDCAPLTRVGDAPVVIPPQPGGSGVAVVADFHAEINGGLEIDIDAPAGTILDIGYEEELIDGRLVLTHYSYRFADRYILRQGRQTTGTAFAVRGYRIVQLVLRNFEQPVTIHGIRAVQRRYPYPRRASFTCSDAMLNQTWDVSVETLRACTNDTIVDCPWRENTLYLNDLLVENVTTLQAFGDERLNARCLRLAASQPRPDSGLLPGAVPVGLIVGTPVSLPDGAVRDLNVDESADRLVLLASNLFLANLLEEHLMYTGDEALVRELIDPTLLRILDTFANWEDSEGVIGVDPRYWNLIDWSYPSALDGHKYTAALNWFHVWSLAATARLLERFAREGDAQAYRRKAGRLATAIDRRYWNERRNCYVECADEPDGLATQLSHAVALLSGHLPAERQDAAIAALERDDLLAPDLYMHHLVFRALVQHGRAERALSLIRNYWGPIVLSGSPTLWEIGLNTCGKAAFDGAGSLCHGFSTTPIDFCQAVILGVSPLAPGFAEFRFDPINVGLRFASGAIPTPRGNIFVAWEHAGSELTATLRTPRGTLALLPSGERLAAGDHRVRLPSGPRNPSRPAKDQTPSTVEELQKHRA